jgi:hypothetical protein
MSLVTWPDQAVIPSFTLGPLCTVDGKKIPEGKRSIGKPRKRSLDDVENYLKKMGVRGYRNIAMYRDAWKLIPKEATVLHRQQSQ